MIGAPEFTADGHYRLDTDEQKAAALLSFVKVLSTGASSMGIDQIMSEAGTLARAVEAVTFRVRVLFVRPGTGEEIGIETVTFINTSAIYGDLAAHARDEAANRLYDRIRDVTVLSTEIVR